MVRYEMNDIRDFVENTPAFLEQTSVACAFRSRGCAITRALPPTRTRSSTRLATLGFPVDEIETRPAITGVVVGRIAALEKHPNADRLQVCTIDVGANAR